METCEIEKEEQQAKIIGQADHKEGRGTSPVKTETNISPLEEGIAKPNAPIESDLMDMKEPATQQEQPKPPPISTNPQPTPRRHVSFILL